ncbi:hypothetical protein [Haladaptatus halobius]|uniref:hypothetical protein n=1 Tax=Haladaptatus halobius TaxID=2884875 RepID=UPI001D09E456|nr:hypothetical protein [Haladaptatus halobius]
MAKSDTAKESDNGIEWIAIGAGLGMAVGAAAGMTGAGLVLGAGAGVAYQTAKSRKN